ncbi:hypothetical protein SAMN05880558_102211 [Aeromonas sp. RU39B]|nr:hypothetical protein SAMN05880558_102211 [Aeromonas sp. RU39B]
MGQLHAAHKASAKDGASQSRPASNTPDLFNDCKPAGVTTMPIALRAGGYDGDHISMWNNLGIARPVRPDFLEGNTVTATNDKHCLTPMTAIPIPTFFIDSDHKVYSSLLLLSILANSIGCRSGFPVYWPSCFF